MTPESRRWTELARRIAEPLRAVEGVEAIVLGGSVARGQADLNSDLDIFVFCRDYPSEETRRAAIAHVEGARWRQHDRRAHGVLRDCFHADDARVDLEFMLVSSFEATLREVLIELDTTRWKQARLGGLRDSQTLHDSDLLGAWRQQVEAYPDALQQAVVEAYLVMDPLWVPEIYARKRGDLLYLSEAICRVANGMLGVLSGLNRRYEQNEYKRLDRLIANFEHSPADLAQRLDAVLVGHPLDGVAAMEQLMEEMFVLVETHLPGIDTEPARAEFSTDTDTEPE